ncbi:hypothetical protein [Cetobacterium sp.]|uniref:hypothetical protein n=1 Tax=Cetobacterium sp. TaxID=2071632 RepID=UPI003F2E33D2
MERDKFMEMIKKIAGAKCEVREPSEDEMLEHEAFALTNPIQMTLHNRILETLNDFGIDIVYRKNKNDIYVINHENEIATSLDKFLEAYTLLLEDFIYNTLKNEMKKEGKECTLKSKLQVKAEVRIEQVKEVIGEENFKEMNTYILQQAQENFKKDMEKAKDILDSKNKKMC